MRCWVSTGLLHIDTDNEVNEQAGVDFVTEENADLDIEESSASIFCPPRSLSKSPPSASTTADAIVNSMTSS